MPGTKPVLEALAAGISRCLTRRHAGIRQTCLTIDMQGSGGYIPTMKYKDWPSLAPQASLANRLFGEDGEQRLEEWLAVQHQRVGNPDFARLFAEHIDLPGIASPDYAHRYVNSRSGSLLGGIRFYSHDVSRPFVEVVAHTFDDLSTLIDTVKEEWQAFGPLHLRLLTVPEALPATRKQSPDGAFVDMTVHAAPYRNMAPPDGRVSLQCFATANAAVELIEQRYADMAARDAELARNVTQALPDDICEWHADNYLRAIWVGNASASGTGRDVIAGCLAIAPGAVEWISGDEVNEEVVCTRHAGRGYAASAQAVWAATVATDPDRLLVGTIDRLNIASRVTAERAGRPAVLSYFFLPL